MKKSHNLLPKEKKESICLQSLWKRRDNSQIVKHVEADHLEGVAVHCNHGGKTLRSKNARNQHKLLHHTYNTHINESDT